MHYAVLHFWPVAAVAASFMSHFRKEGRALVGSVHADRRLPVAPATVPWPQQALTVLSHRSSIAYGRIRRHLHHLHDLTVFGAHSPQLFSLC